MKRVDFDEFADRYSDLLRAHTGFFSSDEAYFARYKVEILRRLVSFDPRRVLEYGCGTGSNIPFLHKAFPGAEIAGSDVSEKSVQVARAANPGARFWIEGQTQREQDSFDVIFVAGVFHHVPPPERGDVARLLYARLRNGGMLVVFEHNPFNPITRRIVSTCPYDEDAVLLRPRELRDWLGRAGLAEISQGYSLFFPPRLTWLLRVEPLLQWLPLGGQYWIAATKR